MGYVFYNDGFWVYAIFDFLDNTQKGLFILSQLVFIIMMYKLGEFINRTLCGCDEGKTVTAPPRKKAKRN